MFKDIRTVCAIELQRIWRGFCIRSLNTPRADRIILKWNWGALKSDSVYVAGEFSNWMKWRMRACPRNGHHCIALSTRLLRGRESFKYKFVVDDLWTCDGSLPMIEDAAGNINNIYNSRNLTDHPYYRSEKSPIQPPLIPGGKPVHKGAAMKLGPQSTPLQLPLNETRLPPATTIGT